MLHVMNSRIWRINSISDRQLATMVTSLATMMTSLARTSHERSKQGGKPSQPQKRLQQHTQLMGTPVSLPADTACPINGHFHLRNARAFNPINKDQKDLDKFHPKKGKGKVKTKPTLLRWLTPPEPSVPTSIEGIEILPTMAPVDETISKDVNCFESCDSILTSLLQ